MAKLKWDERFIVGIYSIDSQHKKLIEIMIDLWDAIESGKGRSIINEVIQSLLDYTRTHFVDEEKYMIQHSYPDYQQHKQDHDRFVQEITKQMMSYMDNKSVPTVKLLQFLAHWLVEHILVYDKKLGVYLREKGIN